MKEKKFFVLHNNDENTWMEVNEGYLKRFLKDGTIQKGDFILESKNVKVVRECEEFVLVKQKVKQLKIVKSKKDGALCPKQQRSKSRMV